MKSVVYISHTVTPETVLKLYRCLDVVLPENVAIKVHTGEAGNQNYLGPDFWLPVVDAVGGTVVETNAAYKGERDTTEKHVKLLEDHGWTPTFNFDLLDAEGPDIALAVPDGTIIKTNYVGKDLDLYNSLLVLSHFKGHPMGGFGGALKQLSIGMASAYGKRCIHGAGDPDLFLKGDHDSFLAAMADAASSIVAFFKARGGLAYINVMKNMSVDCDCCSDAEDPCMADVGILASLDPIAIDQACLDIVYASDDPGRDQLVERIESRNGLYTVEMAAKLGFGSRDYELVEVD